MTAIPAIPDAEQLYRQLRQGVRRLLQPGSAVVGIVSGGAWLSERLQADLAGGAGLEGALPDLLFGCITSTLHRDDFSSRGLAGAGAGGTQLPFDVSGRHIVLVDDVLHTGRTIRAVLNELYDYGRPARVQLAVLVDREGRELPVAADFAALKLNLPADQRLVLERDEAAGLPWPLRLQLRPARAAN